MPVTIGTFLGPYEITALLGKGGMGEVYRAPDTKLKRDVAIKILPDAFSCDSERLALLLRAGLIPMTSLGMANDFSSPPQQNRSLRHWR